MTPDMFIDLTHAENGLTKRGNVYTCCKKPEISIMATVPELNKICLNCYGHWYGENFYLRREWDEFVNSVDEVCA